MSQNADDKLVQIIIYNKGIITQAIGEAISATENSFYPFGRKAKIDQLTKLKEGFEKNTNPENLIAFISAARKSRNPFSSAASSFETLEKKFSGVIHLSDLIDISKSSQTTNDIKTKWQNSISEMEYLENFTPESLSSNFNGNKANIIQVMNAAIDATKKSFYPFGRKAKIEQLTKLKDDFEKNPNHEDLIAFINATRKSRNPFSSTTSSFTILENEFSQNNFLRALINILRSSPKSALIKQKWAQLIKQSSHQYSSVRQETAKGQEDLKKTKSVSTFEDFSDDESTLTTSEDKSSYGSTDDSTADSTADLTFNSSERSSPFRDEYSTDGDKDPDIKEPVPVKKPNANTLNSTTNAKSKAREKIKNEDPVSLIDPENISSFADMSRKIKSIQQEMVKETLNKKYGGNAPRKKKIKLETDKIATPEQRRELQTLLKDAGLLEEENGIYKTITFSEDNKSNEALAVDNAANRMQQQNLGELAYDKEFKIPTYLYKRIQTKSQQFTLIKDAYEKSLPEDADFITKCINNLRENGLDLTSLTYSSHYPFNEEKFVEIMSAGLTDAQKINQICGKLLNVDTKLLMDKINNGFFMSRSMDKKQFKQFIKNFEQELKKIEWTFERLIKEKENLEKSDLKLDIKIIEEVQKQESSNGESPVAQQNYNPERPPNFLSQIKSRNPENSTETKIGTQPDFLSQIKSRNPENSTETKIGTQPDFLSQTANAKKTNKTSKVQEKPNPDQQETSIAAVKAFLSRGGTKTPPQPIDLSGKNKITINSKDSLFIEAITNYLEERFEFTKKDFENEDKVEFNIAKSKTPFTSSSEIKQAISAFADEIKTKYTVFNDLITLDKYSTDFKKALNTDTLEITFNIDYETRMADFEKILTESRILFVKKDNKYIIKKDCWDEILIDKLGGKNFTSDYFVLTNRATNAKVDTNLPTQATISKFRLTLPTKKLQGEFAELLNQKFQSDPDYYLNSSRFMTISSNKTKEFQECLEKFSSMKGFIGEYIQTDSPEFSALIEEKFPRRIKIEVPCDKDKFKSFFADPEKFTEEQRELITCIPGDPTIYYVNFDSLTEKKAEFFRIAAETRAEIDYFDKTTYQYKSIEHADDSLLSDRSPTNSISKLGIFKPEVKDNTKDEKIKYNSINRAS